ncbi:MAG: class IV adenylate cyclase [Candidatus Nanohaloarchaea archaeon]
MEIEQRAFVDSFSQIRQKLREQGFKKERKVQLIDRYFCREKFNTIDDIKMDEPGSYGLRIRENGNSAELNCKTIRWEGDHNAFHEYETQVDSPEETKKILEATGFKNFCTLEKERTVYVSPDGRVEVNLEDINDFPEVIEIEIVTDDMIDEARQRISQLLQKLEVKEEDRIDKSITLHYFQENAFQQE